MFSTEDLKIAIGEVVTLRREAAHRKRDAGEPRNPLRAKPGREQEFSEAARSVQSYDLILNLLEKAVRRQSIERFLTAKVKLRRLVDRMVNFYVGTGLVALATLGFAAAFVLLQFPAPATQAAAIIGVALGLAYAVAQRLR